MKKFIFTPKKLFSKKYADTFNKAQYKGLLWSDILKIWSIYLAILLSIFWYLTFVNLSSTEGFFLRQANNKLDVAKFNYEILKMKLLEHEKETRDKLTFPDKENPIKVITITKE